VISSRAKSIWATLIAFAVVTGCAAAPASSPGSRSSRRVVATAAPLLRHVRVFSRTFQLPPSGPLQHPQTIRLQLTQRVPSGWAVVVATAESRRGPWSYLPARLTASRRTAVFITSHHSLFTVIGEDLRSLLRIFKTEFLDGLSSGATAQAVPPSCLAGAEPDLPLTLDRRRRDAVQALGAHWSSPPPTSPSPSRPARRWPP
jgi:hypothetical protein